MMNHAKMNSHVVTACIAAVVAFGASWATGQSAPVVPNAIMAREFLLIDKESRVRGRWHIGHQDEVRFTLKDPKYHDRVELVAAPDGSTRLALRSDNPAQKQTGITVSVSRDSSTFAMFSQGNGAGFAVDVSPAFSQMGIGDMEGTSVILPKSSINLSASHGHSVICLGQKSGDDSAADCWSFDGRCDEHVPNVVEKERFSPGANHGGRLREEKQPQKGEPPCRELTRSERRNRADVQLVWSRPRTY